MKIILLKDVPKLGRRYDIKDVASGHALNLLIPQGLAVSATPAAVARSAAEKARTEGERKVHEDLLAKNIDDLKDLTLTIIGKANEKGHLFAGLHREEIVAELTKQTRLELDPSFIKLEHPIKEIGEYMIEAAGKGKSATFKLIIKAA
ncbi:MAG: large subunit ribosomal protein [Candidatus Parcubacteria bacterium]|jgi:large subunit ribosomal protein L9|nr:large subunit ribosomal protein [Candidatus Parcubacteria bacterium]